MPRDNRQIQRIYQRLDKIDQTIDKTQNEAIGAKGLYQELLQQKSELHHKEKQIIRWKTIAFTIIIMILFILLYGAGTN